MTKDKINGMLVKVNIMKIAVLVSGGVDSSVALKLLKDEGHDITAFYLKIWLEDELSYLGDCPWQEDLAYVIAVCEQLDVPLEVISLQKEYWDQVVAYTVSEARAGMTPNPDILCNQRIKFGAFFDKIDKRFDKVASGHYAQVKFVDGKYQLHKGPDPIKDQTYFLSHLSQEQLSRILFPIGSLDKGHVRALAEQFDLPTKSRKDSQGICFLGKFSFREFLKYHLEEKPGDLVEIETGEVIGEHKGYWFYTLGQRQGLGLPGGPWYVVDKDINTNKIYISRSYYSQEKERDSFSVDNINWIADIPVKIDLGVKIRHGSTITPATVIINNDKTVSVKLSERDQGIAPGQFAAFYDGDQCLGSGIITRL
jgi:tRNA (5-methylaminomethyl-2-thiouridylate)-methyltransferase